jgi:membrane associated rhomboid family serine protease/Flp pilus assembly protein TadD
MAKCIQCGRALPAFSFGKRLCQWCVQHEAAQRGEISENAIQTVMPAPWVRRSSAPTVTQVLLGINVAVFLGMALSGISITDPTTQDLLHWGANSAGLTLSGDWWRLVSSVFLHIGIIHIALNMWCLWSLGTVCESLYGSWTFAAVYFISGVSGSLASIAYHPHVVSAGASGAIFGIAGALISSYYFGEVSTSRGVVAGSLRSVLVFAGYNLFFGAVSGITDNAAHVGGLAGGLILGALIAKVAPQKYVFAPRVAVILFGALVVAGAGFWLQQARGYEARMARAEQLLREKKTSQAIGQLQSAIRQHPAFAPAHFALAHAYFNLRQYPQAEGELNRVLELQPHEEGASYELGVAYLNEKRTGDAKSEFAQMLTQNSNDADAHFGMGLALAAEGNDPAAIEEYSTAARLDPDEGVNYEMGISYAKLKKYDDAITVLLKDRQQNGDDQYIESALADAYQAKGMKVEAQDAQRKAEQLQKSGTIN